MRSEFEPNRKLFLPCAGGKGSACFQGGETALGARAVGMADAIASEAARWRSICSLAFFSVLVSFLAAFTFGAAFECGPALFLPRLSMPPASISIV